MKRYNKLSIILGMIFILSIVAQPILAQDGSDTARPPGWDDESHEKSTDPNYAVVFPQDEVNTITVTINPENWQAMTDNMTELYGEFGSRQRGGQPPQAGQPSQGQPPQGRPPQGQAPGTGRPGGAGAGGFGITENPVWIPATVEFEGQVWTHVGIRFKGNSSLMSSWGSGIWKLPFKLDFDEFEDEYPEIDDQRFYGFKQLSFSSNWGDQSFLHEKVAADIFREAGVPAAQTAFYAVYVDYGEGPFYFGLYTAVELVDDTMIETQFDDNSGNVYKPEGSGATFALGSFNEASFDKETNQEENDYSDVLALYDALHADTRTTDPEAWRDNLEAVLNVDGFLNWLAVNTVIQNWDTYGVMSHNYYLYTDPSTGLINWIPWDNNEALNDRSMGGNRATLPLDLSSVGAEWPLIRYLIDDPIYHDLYVGYVAATIDGPFDPARMTVIYQDYHDLIAPYVANEQPDYTYLNNTQEFDYALAVLIEHVNQRYTAAQEYLNSQATTQ